MSESGTVVGGVRLPFCVMNASGSATTASELRALARSRTGALVLPTATVHPFLHPSFRSLRNPGYDALLPLVRELATEERVRPVVASVAGATPDEYGFLAKAFVDAGAAVVEVNLADPWVATALAPFEDAQVLGDVVRRVAETPGCTCWVKIAERPAMPYARLVEVLLDGGAHAVVARNDFAGFEKLLVEAARPIDVVASGGISSAHDVARALGKGAKAVQVDAWLRADGPGIFARLEREMRRGAAPPGDGARAPRT